MCHPRIIRPHYNAAGGAWQAAVGQDIVLCGLAGSIPASTADPNSDLVQGAARAAANGLEGLRVQILGGVEHLDDPPEASIFSAIEQQLGLKLERTRAPGEVLVIDHVEKPSEN